MSLLRFSMGKKLNKLKRDPKLFCQDSKAYLHTRRALYQTWMKMGTFSLVIGLSLCVILYYTVIASPRYVSTIQFVIKKNKPTNVPTVGLAALGMNTPALQDSQILKTYIESADMAVALAQEMQLKSYYQRKDWDIFSRLADDATYEEYILYYHDHLNVQYDELSEVLLVEIEAFDEAFALSLANAVLKQSQTFINSLGSNMAVEQTKHAESEVLRAYDHLKQQQSKLIDFQNNFNLVNAEVETASLQAAINELEAKVIAQQTELKSLQAYMRPNAPAIKSIQYSIKALKAQLKQEKKKLISNSDQSLNYIQAKYKEVELNSKLALDLYQSSLASLELVRASAFENIRYLLLIQAPHLAEEETYPRRLYAITTWFVVLTLCYMMIKLMVSIIQERRD